MLRRLRSSSPASAPLARSSWRCSTSTAISRSTVSMRGSVLATTSTYDARKRTLAAPKRKKSVSADRRAAKAALRKGADLLRDFLHDAPRLFLVAASGYVGLRDEADEAAALLSDGQAANLMLRHQLQRLVEILPGGDGGEV